MEQQQFKVLEYLNERINGNIEAVYIPTVNEEFKNNEIGYYTENLIDEGYVKSRNNNWAIRNGRHRSKYNNNIYAIIFENLRIGEKGKAYIEEHNKDFIQKVAEKIVYEVKSFISEVSIKTKSGLAKWLAGIIIVIITSAIIYALKYYF